MKKQAFLSALLATATLCTPAFAADWFNPYVGVEAQHLMVDFKPAATKFVDDKTNGGAIYVGNRFTRYFALEGGFFSTQSTSRDSIIGTSKWKLNGWSMDAVGYLPVNASGTFEMIGAVGATHTTIKTNMGTFGKHEDDDLEPRFGLGMQYAVTDQIGLRGMARWQKSGFKNADHAWIYSAGLNYNF